MSKMINTNMKIHELLKEMPEIHPYPSYLDTTHPHVNTALGDRKQGVVIGTIGELTVFQDNSRGDYKIVLNFNTEQEDIIGTLRLINISSLEITKRAMQFVNINIDPEFRSKGYGWTVYQILLDEYDIVNGAAISKDGAMMWVKMINDPGIRTTYQNESPSSAIPKDGELSIKDGLPYPLGNYITFMARKH